MKYIVETEKSVDQAVTDLQLKGKHGITGSPTLVLNEGRLLNRNEPMRAHPFCQRWST